MKIVLVSVMLLGTLAAPKVDALQVCPNGIPATTPTSDFTDHGDGTVTHLSTGLTWKRCPEGQGGTDCSNGTASVYTWQQALQVAGDHSFAGHADWRLPNIRELTSIIELACTHPTINLDVFPMDSGTDVWSSSPFALAPNYAWGVIFSFGGDNAYNRSDEFRVRLVRGGQ
jgi:hypothetical protein